jgi:Cu-processing system ATP-binding protein
LNCSAVDLPDSRDLPGAAAATPGSGAPVIEVERASRFFGEIRAVDEVSLRVGQGELFGLIGPNGAGKSTLFKLMLGLVPLSAGSIRIRGEPVRGRGFRRVRRQVGYLPENVVLYDNLTALETMWFFAALKGVERDGCWSLLEQVGLGHAAQRRVRGFSKGMRQRLGFAQALLGRPSILFLDEPTSGLDPEGIRDFYRSLQALRERGVTMILTSHILAEIEQRVDRLAILREGRVHASGTVRELRRSSNLQTRYHVSPQPGRMESLNRTLARAGIPFSVHGASVSIECRHEHKMAVLGALSGVAADVADIQVREASLEDILFVYAAGDDAPPAQPAPAGDEAARGKP